MAGSLSPHAADLSARSDRSCVVAFHLAVIDAIRLSTERDRDEVTIYQAGVGEYYPGVAGYRIPADSFTPERIVFQARSGILVFPASEIREVCVLRAPEPS